jgi:hypothetical protein
MALMSTTLPPSFCENKKIQYLECKQKLDEHNAGINLLSAAELAEVENKLQFLELILKFCP